MGGETAEAPRLLGASRFPLDAAVFLVGSQQSHWVCRSFCAEPSDLQTVTCVTEERELWVGGGVQLHTQLLLCREGP